MNNKLYILNFEHTKEFVHASNLNGALILGASEQIKKENSLYLVSYIVDDKEYFVHDTLTILPVEKI